MAKIATVFKLSGIALFLTICALLVLVSSPKGGWKALSVQTGSMRPAINPGDMVLVHRVPATELSVGDVITYTNPHNKKQTITHRIVAIHGPQITVKGDANKKADPVVFANSVVGRVKGDVPYLGHAVDFVRKPIGLAILIYVPALTIIISEIRRLSADYRKKQPYISAQTAARMKEMGRAGKNKLASASKLTVILVLASMLFALPVQAGLRSTATLTGNTISANVPITGKHVTFRLVTLRCSSDNTVSTSKRPKIVIQNWTNQNITTHHWHIDDNSGTIITIPNGTVLKKLHQYVFTPLLADGLQYAGDRLMVFNDNNQAVDALSWGTDTTAFNPAIPAVAAGSRLERRPFNKDTDKASDWRVFNHVCHCPVLPGVQAGDDSGDFGDLSETNRVMTVGAFNMQEL